jgi:hypothetical protein
MTKIERHGHGEELRLRLTQAKGTRNILIIQTKRHLPLF